MSLTIPDGTPFRSQHGEDALLAEHFGARRGGVFVEVGATDGEVFSNTYYFERSLGWTGLLIEANPEQAEVCRRKRPASTVLPVAVVAPEAAGRPVRLQVVDGYAPLSSLGLTRQHRKVIDLVNRDPAYHASVRDIEVPTLTLDQALEQARLPRIDFMSIDVEGHEAEVLAGFSLGTRWRPQVLLVERTSWFPDRHVLLELFRSNYRYVQSVAINDWYEPEQRVGRRLAGVARQCGHGFGRMSLDVARAMKARVVKARRLPRGDSRD